MDSNFTRKKAKPPRVLLTEEMRRRLIEDLMSGSVSGFAERKSLPYQLIYNIVHGRVKSLSARHFQMIFDENPLFQPHDKEDATRFRQLVDLWLYLNDGVSKADLYHEFYGEDYPKKVDYRIFNGKIGSVDTRFVRQMEKKFAAAGIDRDTIERWIGEFTARDHKGPVPYERVRPLLIYLRDTLDVHPTALLNQWYKRYESGRLKHVSRRVYNEILKLQQKTNSALASGSRLKMDRLREEVYGRKPGYSLFAEVSEELAFLKKYAHRSPKKYLGRSLSMYNSGQCRRLPTWRAEKILKDSLEFIRREPRVALQSLPRSLAGRVISQFLAVMDARTADLLSRGEGLRLEKQILKPHHSSDEYKKRIYGFTRIDMAGHLLGMNRKAFDLMVAENCEIFRKIGTYERRWYLSDLYLKELSQEQNFTLITTKYEWIARHRNELKPIKACMN